MSLPAVHPLFRLIAALPLGAVHALGALAGLLVYAASPIYRRRLQANLVQALGEARARPLFRSAACEAGRQALEFAWVLLRPRAEVLAHVRHIEGLEIVEAARARGAGIIYLTPHLGCFEIAAQFLAERFGALTALYRAPRKAVLAPLIEAGRNRAPMRAVPADLSGVRQLMKALRKGEAIGILPDQAPARGEGVWAPFFGRPAWTMTLAARLAELPDTALVRVWVERLPAGRGYAIRFSEGPALPAGDAVARATAINRSIEGLILARPTQYLWGYNRYKRPAGVPPPPDSAEPAERQPC